MKLCLFYLCCPIYEQQHFYLRGPNVLSDCTSVKNNFEDEDDMEHLWHSTDRAKLKCWWGVVEAGPLQGSCQRLNAST
jgi:hypothetical protein